MKAVKLAPGVGNIELREIAEPEPGRGWCNCRPAARCERGR